MDANLRAALMATLMAFAVFVIGMGFAALLGVFPVGLFR